MENNLYYLCSFELYPAQLQFCSFGFIQGSWRTGHALRCTGWCLVTNDILVANDIHVSVDIRISDEIRVTDDMGVTDVFCVNDGIRTIDGCLCDR